MQTCSRSCCRRLVGCGWECGQPWAGGGWSGQPQPHNPSHRHPTLGSECGTSSCMWRISKMWSFLSPTSVPLSAHPECLHGAGSTSMDRSQSSPPKAAVSWRAHPEGQHGAEEKVREQRVAAGTGRCHLSDRAPKPTLWRGHLPPTWELAGVCAHRVLPSLNYVKINLWLIPWLPAEPGCHLPRGNGELCPGVCPDLLPLCGAEQGCPAGVGWSGPPATAPPPWPSMETWLQGLHLSRAPLPACHTWNRNGQSPPVCPQQPLAKVLKLWSQIGFRFGAIQWCRGRRGGLCSVLCCADGKPVCPLIPHLSFVLSDALSTTNACPGSEQELFLLVLPGGLGGSKLSWAWEGLNCCLPPGSSLNRASSSNHTAQELHAMNSSFPGSRGSGVLGMGTGGLSVPLGNPASPRDAPSHSHPTPFGAASPVTAACAVTTFSARFFWSFSAKLYKLN